MGDKPQGFDHISNNEYSAEVKRAKLNDQGLRNVSASDHFYQVNEQAQQFDSLLSAFDKSRNASLQNVGYFKGNHNPKKGEKATEDYAYVSSGNGNTGDRSVLKGKADGHVILEITKEGQTFDFDITKVAAEAGITAAGIRRTQQDIAKDGEVSRPEQKTIIDTINKAKEAAGIVR